MIKCPNCGSTAQVKPLSLRANGDEFLVVKREYSCGCGVVFKTTQYYYAQDREVVYETKDN
jgi:hypothetical protein